MQRARENTWNKPDFRFMSQTDFWQVNHFVTKLLTLVYYLVAKMT